MTVALETIDKKLGDLLSSRANLDREIVRWKQAKDSLLAVIESEESDPPDVQISVVGDPGKQTLKFTEAVRLILQQQAKDTYITAPDIRVFLLNFGFDLSAKAQPLSPIHNCLRRLSEQGEIAPLKANEGQIIGYKWLSPIERAIDDENSFYAATGEGVANCYARLLKPPTSPGIGPNPPLRRNEAYERWKEVYDAKQERERTARVDKFTKEIKKNHEEAK
jgi:hypothetical protein